MSEDFMDCGHATARQDACAVCLFDTAHALEEAQADISALQGQLQELKDDQRILRCAFCSQEYPPGTLPTQDEALTAHILQCEKHPLFMRLKELEAQLAPKSGRLETGGLVYLKSGGPPLTVVLVSTLRGTVKCSWMHADGTLATHEFPRETLVREPPATAAPGLESPVAYAAATQAYWLSMMDSPAMAAWARDPLGASAEPAASRKKCLCCESVAPCKCILQACNSCNRWFKCCACAAEESGGK